MGELRAMVAVVFLAVIASSGPGSAQERAPSALDAEGAALELVASLRATEDALVKDAGAERTGRAQTEIQMTVAQLEDLARLLREGASQGELKERYRTLQVQRRRLAALSAVPGGAKVPKEIVEAAAAQWAVLAARFAER